MTLFFANYGYKLYTAFDPDNVKTPRTAREYLKQRVVKNFGETAKQV